MSVARALCIIALLACVPTIGRYAKAKPQISSFSATPLRLTEGQVVSLSARFASGTGVVTGGSGQIVITSDTTASWTAARITAAPVEAQTLTLQVTGIDGSIVTQTVSLTVALAATTPTISTTGRLVSNAAGLIAQIEPVTGLTYAWEIDGGAITSPPSGSSIVWSAGAVGAATLRCTASNPLQVAAPPAIATLSIGGIETVLGEAITPGDVDASGSAARISGPQGMLATADGSILFADGEWPGFPVHAIRQWTAGGTLSTIAGASSAIAGNLRKGSADGAAADARFCYPQRLAASSDGTLFILEDPGEWSYCARTAGPLRKLSGGQVTTVAVTFPVTFTTPVITDIAVDGSDRLWIAACQGSSQCNLNTGAVFSLDGAGTATQLAGGFHCQRYGFSFLVSSDANDIIVSEGATHALSHIDAAGQVTLFAGSGVAQNAGDDDGPALQARLQWPEFLVREASGSIVFFDQGANSTIGAFRRVTTDGNVITIAGASPAAPNLIPGWLGAPSAILPLADGDFLVSDYDASVLLRLRVP